MIPSAVLLDFEYLYRYTDNVAIYVFHGCHEKYDIPRKSGEMWMEEFTKEQLREQQIEALKIVNEYLGKLVPNMEMVVEELNGNKKEDTDVLLEQIVNGLNWVIEVFNGTMSLINEEREVINKDKINSYVLQLSDALIAHNDANIVTAIDSGILPFLREFQSLAGMYF